MSDDTPFAPIVRKPKRVLEKTIERRHVYRVKVAGGTAYKFSSPGRPDVPDRIDLYGVERMIDVCEERLGIDLHRDDAVALLAAAITFTETKAPGKKPTPSQHREHERLRSLGFTVNVVDE